MLEVLRRECEAKAVIVGRGRTVVPNAFELELPSESYARLAGQAGPVGERLASEVRRHAAERRFSFAGPVAVRLCPPRAGAGAAALPGAQQYHPALLTARVPGPRARTHRTAGNKADHAHSTGRAEKARSGH